MLRLTACLAVLAALCLASPAAAHMSKCQRSCVGKPYSPTCVAWTFEGPRSAVFENECFADCMLKEDPTAHITQHDVELPEACAKEYAELGYWYGDIDACFVCPPPAAASDELPEEDASLSLGEEPLDAEEEPLAAADLKLEPFPSAGDDDQEGQEEEQQLPAVQTKELSAQRPLLEAPQLIVEPVDGEEEQQEEQRQLIVEPVDGEEEEQPKARRLARRMLA
ncbi:hypothetical protein ABPG75_004981 [Micractinium tetrahymenae]